MSTRCFCPLQAVIIGQKRDIKKGGASEDAFPMLILSLVAPRHISADLLEKNGKL